MELSILCRFWYLQKEKGVRLNNERKKEQKIGVQHEDFLGGTNPSTTLAQICLIAEFWWDPVR